MKRHLDRAADRELWILGKDWKQIGRDGGTETSAWRDVSRPEEAAGLEQGRALWPSGYRTGDRARRPMRTWADRLFRDGLMAPIVVIGLLLLGPIAWLLGAK